jgi:uncharacterized protein YbaR (Trm112 family)
MARRMSGSAHWEKQGNAQWVACPRCAQWFPADPQLVAQRRIELVCPRCAHAFHVEPEIGSG